MSEQKTDSYLAYDPRNCPACRALNVACGSTHQPPTNGAARELAPRAANNHVPKPARSALKLPAGPDGDTRLVLPDAAFIPQELVNEKRWLIWTAAWKPSKEDPSKGKWMKPPRSPFTGEQIGATEKYADKFGTFAEAHAEIGRAHV